jgi:hypothetical protein
MLNKHENWRKESKKVNYKISDRMKRIKNYRNIPQNKMFSSTVLPERKLAGKIYSKSVFYVSQWNLKRCPL